MSAFFKVLALCRPITHQWMAPLPEIQTAKIGVNGLIFLKEHMELGWGWGGGSGSVKG